MRRDGFLDGVEIRLLDFVDQRRRTDEGVGLEEEGRDRQSRRREPEQVSKCGARAGQTVGLHRPAQLAQDGGRVENASLRPIRPLVFDEASDVHVLELSEARAVRIHQVHTIVARLRRKRLSFDPSTHERRDLVSADEI